MRQDDQGKIFIHCFGGCKTHSVLDSLGLEFKDLFPPREIGHHAPRKRLPFNPMDVLQCVAFEALFTFLCAENLAAGGALSEADRERLATAAQRLQAAVQAVRNG